MNKESSLKIDSLPAVGLFICVCLISGCAKKGASEDPQTADSSEESPEQLPGKDPTQGQIKIGPKIAEACGIDATDSFFEYNSSKMSPTASRVLQQVATCFISGPLKGQSLRAVGHADPRGDEEYNMVLGGKRADTVASVLTKNGMAESQIATTSRGELEARGEDEASWKLDRKVELLVAE